MSIIPSQNSDDMILFQRQNPSQYSGDMISFQDQIPTQNIDGRILFPRPIVLVNNIEQLTRNRNAKRLKTGTFDRSIFDQYMTNNNTTMSQSMIVPPGFSIFVVYNNGKTKTFSNTSSFANVESLVVLNTKNIKSFTASYLNEKQIESFSLNSDGFTISWTEIVIILLLLIILYCYLKQQ